MTRSTRCDVRRATARGCCIGALPFAAVLLSATAAHADRDPAAAQALFKRARSLLEAGDYAAACPKFEASLALNPSASTLINIAKCHEHDGKLATAWEDYHRAIVVNNHETQGEERRRKLESIANEGLAALAPRLPKLLVEIQSPPPGLKVMRDEVEIPLAALGEALPLDPGAHRLSVSASGYQTVTRAVTLEEGKTETVSISLVKDARQQGEGERAGKGEPKADTKAKTESSGVPTWAWIAGAGGLGLLAGSIPFLVDDISAVNELNAHCMPTDRGTYCTPGYDFQRDNARKNRDLALTLTLGGASLIAIGAATVGLVQSASTKREAPEAAAKASLWISPGGAGAVIRGRF
jgi:tetratricopeptide (TPR) repeat protein